MLLLPLIDLYVPYQISDFAYTWVGSVYDVDIMMPYKA